LKIVALGRTKLLYDSINLLYRKGFNIGLIATSKAAPEYEVDEYDFRKLAKEVGAEFINDSNINSLENIEKIKKIKPDIAISVNWQSILEKKIIDCFPNGILNCHVGDLPKYRGNAVINWALINGENRVTITIHKMDENLDSGDIVLKKNININKKTKVLEILSECNKVVPQMFYESIDGLLNERLEVISQSKNLRDVLRCYPRKPMDSFIDWKNTAEYIDRLIRASSEPFIGAYTYLNNQRIYILKAHVEKLLEPSLYIPGQVLWKKDDTGEVAIGTGKDILVIEKIKEENGQLVLPTQCIKSLRTRLGIQAEDEIYLLWQKIRKLEKIIEEKTRY